MSECLSENTKSAYTGLRTDIVGMVPKESITILDVGCSSGVLGDYLCSLNSARKVTGIESNANLYEEAKEKIHKVLNVNLNEKDLCSVFDEEKFDCIVFGDVLEHLIEPEKHLLCAAKLLTPGGVIIISMPNVRHLYVFYSIFLKGVFPRKDRGIFDKTHLRWFTISDARNLISEAGLKELDISYSLRIGDRGNGLLNKIVRKAFGPIAGFFPIREFFTYQYCFKTGKL